MINDLIFLIMTKILYGKIEVLNYIGIKYSYTLNVKSYLIMTYFLALFRFGYICLNIYIKRNHLN